MTSVMVPLGTQPGRYGLDTVQEDTAEPGAFPRSRFEAGGLEVRSA
jgi:hypothetical protein